MRWVLITPFGTPVEPEVNRILAMVSGPTAVWAASAAGSAAAAKSSANSDAGRVRRRIARHHHLDVGRHRLFDGAREGRAIGREDEAGREQCEYVFELPEVAGDQRIGRRDRRVGDADIHRSEPEQRVLEVVAGEDHDGALGREIARLSSAVAIRRTLSSVCA